MPARLTEARLLICRSGASTVAENTVAGRPALLIPYPHAIDGHQAANARAVAVAGGARVLPQAVTTPASLAGTLTDLLTVPGRLATMAEAARADGVPDAVDRLADLVERLASTGRAATGAITGGPNARRAAA
jgi:UDP-N-acetylglucosamine--N-acetylmuramyl-(pentapeptide) pyrophosphoryl-undecaprenol N-acetylglucosamine transferase